VSVDAASVQPGEDAVKTGFLQPLNGREMVPQEVVTDVNGG
jgi:hypothetical protein